MKSQALASPPRLFSRARKWAAARSHALSVGLVTLTMSVQARASGSGGLPWDSPLSTLQNDLTGPIATGISVVAFFGAGAALVFQGDELGNLAKRLLYVVLAIAVIVMGNKFLSALGLTGALVY